MAKKKTTTTAKKTAKPKAKRTSSAKSTAKKPTVKVQNEVGLGDVIEKVTTVTGIKKAIEFFTPEGKDCGCDKRKEKFNEVKFKYGTRKKIERCPSKDEIELFDAIIARSVKRLSKQDARSIAELYSNIFGTRFEIWCGLCVHIWKSRIKELKAVFAFYRDELRESETNIDQS